MSFEIKTVTPDDDDTRVDRWFKRYYPDIGNGLIQKMLRKGMIRVDGKRAKSNDRLQAGQDIKIPNAILTAVSSPKPKKLPPKLTADDVIYIKSLVIYEDEHVIALNKPPGIATQGGSKVSEHIDGYLDGLKGKDGQRPKLVHRLDRDTSGVMLIAKSQKAAKHLGEAFKERNVRKYYWAITRPAPDLNEGVINIPLSKSKGRGGERMARDNQNGKKSETYYTVIERIGKKAAWVAFWPRTGRTHQIRAHSLIMGCTIFGDPKYCNEELMEWTDEAGALEDRLHLHARRIIIPHPVFQNRFIDVVAELPDHMRKTWKYFGFNAKDKTDPFEGVE